MWLNIGGFERFETDDSDIEEQSGVEYIAKSISIELGRVELNSLIQFISDSIDYMRECTHYCHFHYRDWNETWTGSDCDLVLNFNIEELSPALFEGVDSL